MSNWLYQINQEKWEPERFRMEIWENERWQWTVNQAYGATDGGPRPGDSVAFYYAKAGGADPGFYGWAVILEYHRAHDGDKTLYFRPVAPTNHLKMHPWWDAEAEDVAKTVRQPMYQGTLFPVPDELWRRIRRGITTWAAGRVGELSSTATSAA